MKAEFVLQDGSILTSADGEGIPVHSTPMPLVEQIKELAHLHKTVMCKAVLDEIQKDHPEVAGFTMKTHGGFAMEISVDPETFEAEYKAAEERLKALIGK